MPVAAYSPTPRYRLEYLDGWLGTPVEISRVPQIANPFKDNPNSQDITARAFSRVFAVDPRSTNWRRLTTRNPAGNLLLYSNQFSNAAWTKSNVAVTAAQIANPWDGSVTVDAVLETATTATHLFNQAVSLPSSTTHCFSVLCYSAGRTNITLRIGRSGPKYAEVSFVLGLPWDGIVSFVSDSGGSGGIINLGNGWYLPYITLAKGDATSYVQIQYGQDASFGSYLGDATKGFYIANTTLEAATAPRCMHLLTTSAARTVSFPDLDWQTNYAGALLPDFFAHLTAESDLQPESFHRSTFTRRYATIPSTQRVPSSRWIDRPNLNDTFVASTAWAVSFDDLGKYSWIFQSSARKSTGLVVGALTPGTISRSVAATTKVYQSMPAVLMTFAEGAHSVAIYSNTSASSFQSSLASSLTGLTNISVTATETSVSISWTGTMKYISCSSNTAVQISGGAGSNTITLSTAQTDPSRTDTDSPNQNPSLRFFTLTGHGAAVGDRVAFWNGDRLVGKSKVQSVVDANNFSVLAADVDGKDLTVTHIAFSPAAYKCVAGGAIECDTEVVTEFFLPYFSILASGATMGASYDWPVQVVQIDPVSWLTALMAYWAAPTTANWAVHSTQGKKAYDGPIMAYEYTRVSLVDAIDTITP